MIRKSPVVVAVAACLLATSALAAQERWRVTEGLQGEPHGVWTIEKKGEDLTAYAEMFDANGEKTTYFLSGKFEKGEFVFDRQSESDKTKCTYRMTGTPPETGEPLSGVIDCDSANQTDPNQKSASQNVASQTWRANKIPEPVEIKAPEEKMPKIPFPKSR